MTKVKELTASQMGRLGALATNKKLSAKQRKKNASNASKARWKKYYAENNLFDGVATVDSI